MAGDAGTNSARGWDGELYRALGQSVHSRDEQGSNLHAISGPSLRPFRRRVGIPHIISINLIVPHLHENGGSKIIDRLPKVLDFRKCILPDRPLTPLFALLFALISRTHRFPSKSVGMIDVLLRALRPLLMDQIKVTESCLFVGVQFE